KFSEEDFEALRAFAYQSKVGLTSQAYEKLRHTWPELKIDSLKVLRRHIHNLSGLSPVNYDCCVNSCCAFTGHLSDLTQCPHCNEDRFEANGHISRKQFQYIPLKPRLQKLYTSHRSAHLNRHQSRHEHQPGKICDFYDSQVYQELLDKYVKVLDCVLPHKYFGDEWDIALLVLTDGFQFFRKRKYT
ncbi:hypothetical protein M422DRAFT_103022, partial [Sphaerobolus stellatus SS14]